jgi:hypothetical protein
MPTPQLKSFADEYNVPIAKVEEFWASAKKEYGEDYEKVAGTVKKMCANYNKSKNESNFDKVLNLLREGNIILEKLKEPFIVYRVGTHEGLNNSNGGDAQGVAAFLAASDDYDNPTVSTKKDSFMFKYEVTYDGEFSSYKTYNKGSGGDGDKIGKIVKHGGEQYSFPSSGFTFKLLSKIPMSDIRADLKAKGYEDFDCSGSAAGGKSIIASFQKRT